jgi:quercetin dioxygenase-like cupin family protein
VADEAALVAPIDDSALALRTLALRPGDSAALGDGQHDSLLYVATGSGALLLGTEEHALHAGSAGLLLAGEGATISSDAGLEAALATVGPAVDRHAPLGPREVVVSLDGTDAQRASGARSFQILFGPHNGSTRATLFAGFIPPGKAPWHYHLYDEIVLVPEGPGRLHLEEATTELEAGSAFRLRPRQVHIVENPSSDRELTVIGIFTPAGSPSAAYLTPGVAAEYRFAG